VTVSRGHVFVLSCQTIPSGAAKKKNPAEFDHFFEQATSILRNKHHACI
jgi:hypothetical protein